MEGAIIIGKYIRYYLKEALLFILFSPIILGLLIILLFTSLTNYLWDNPHPKETPNEHQKRRSGYYHPDW